MPPPQLAHKVKEGAERHGAVARLFQVPETLSPDGAAAPRRARPPGRNITLTFDITLARPADVYASHPHWALRGPAPAAAVCVRPRVA